MFACIHSRRAQLSLPGLPHPDQALLVDCAYSFSPKIEETAAGTVIADLEGCNQLFGSDAGIAEKIARRAAELGLEVSVAVAANPDAAACASAGLPGVTVIPPGREAEVLAALPVQTIADCGFGTHPLLDAPQKTRRIQQRVGHPPFQDGHFKDGQLREILETLEAWGIRTLGQLAALPQAGVSERLGTDGLRLLELARGASNRALIASMPAPGFEKSIELDYSVALLEPLLFVIASLLNQLCRNLEERALATNEITVRLTLEPRHADEEPGPRSKVQGPRETATPTTDHGPRTTDHIYECVLRLPVPMLNNQAFLRLLQLDLEQHPPQAPVVAVWVRTRPVKPRALQDGLFVPLAPEPQKLELTLARITKLVGEGNAGAAELLDTHHPDAFVVRRFEVRGEKVRGSRFQVRGFLPSHLAPRTPHLPSASHLAPRTFLAFRHFRPPLPAQVDTASKRPARVAARGIRGKVVALAGPWRSAGDWWLAEPWDRDEWDVTLAGGELYRIYFDRRQRGWFVDGSYD